MIHHHHHQAHLVQVLRAIPHQAKAKMKIPAHRRRHLRLPLLRLHLQAAALIHLTQAPAQAQVLNQLIAAKNSTNQSHR